MDTVLAIILGLLILVVLVVLHELGHAIVARRNGVVVEEFGIGFPPRAWARKLKNGVLFSLNWLPLGGFVKLQGEHDAADKKGDYGAASFWQKTKILLAGVATNWLIAAVLLTCLSFVGLPKIIPNQFYVSSDAAITREEVEIVSLTSDSPAERASLKSGDKIIRLEGRAVSSVQGLLDLNKEYKGQEVEVIYTRDGGAEASATVKLNNDDEVILGASLGQRELIKATWSAPISGFAVTGQLTWTILEGLGDLFGNLASGIVMQFSSDETTRSAADENIKAVSESVAGPVGILGTIFPAAEKEGLTQVVFLTAILSLTLAVMNALPIPALDGGRWFVSGLFRILKKPLTKDIEEKIQATGFIILMGLVILVTIADVTRLF